MFPESARPKLSGSPDKVSLGRLPAMAQDNLCCLIHSIASADMHRRVGLRACEHRSALRRAQNNRAHLSHFTCASARNSRVTKVESDCIIRTAAEASTLEPAQLASGSNEPRPCRIKTSIAPPQRHAPFSPSGDAKNEPPRGGKCAHLRPNNASI